MNRRRFLQLTGFGLLAASMPLAACSLRTYPPAPAGARLFNAKELAVLAAMGETLLPDGPGLAPLSAAGWRERFDAFMAAARPQLRHDLRQVLDLFEDWPVLNLSATAFSAAGGAERRRVLEGWQNSSLALKRKGFSGLKQLSASVFYMQRAAWAEIRYPGPWIGRIDVGTGLDNRKTLPSPNPNVLRRFEG